MAGVAGVAVAAVTLLAGQVPGWASTVPLAISVSGNHFVDGAGQTIRLLGVDHASSEYACVDGYGYNDGYQNDADAAAVASWHANAVRVPLNEDCWLGINGQPNNSLDPGQALTASGYRQAVEAYVSALNSHGIYAILDLHWSAPGTQVAAEQQPMPDDDHSRAFWQSVASTFKSNPAVVFDVFNEPYDPTDPRSGTDTTPQDQVSWNCWDTGTANGPAGGAPCYTSAYDENGAKTMTYRIAGLQALVDAIRGTGATQPVLTAGLNYANDLSQWITHAPDDPLNQEAASFHNYQGQACSDVSCWAATIAPVAANVPVVTGEFGESDFDNASCGDRTPSTFDGDFMSWADQQGISYLANGWELLDASEISAEGCSAYFLTSDHSGTPAAPNGTALHDHLAALAGSAGGGTGSTTATSTPPGAGSTGSINLTELRSAVRRGGAAVGFTLRAAHDCTGTLTGETVHAYAAHAVRRGHHGVSLGAVHFRLRAGRAKLVTLRLTARARGLLAREHALRVRITVTLVSGAMHGVTRHDVTLRAPARR